MNPDRQPLIDPSTYEVLFEVYAIVAAADKGKGSLNPTDVSYIAGQLKTVLTLNSLAPTDPRTDPKVMSHIKELGRKFLP